MQIRRLEPSDAATWLVLRMHSLREHPEAFLKSVEEEQDTPLAEIEVRFAADPSEAVTLGGFVGEDLVATIGVYRPSRMKTRHKAIVWGVYVRRDQREKGAGRALMEAAVAAARAMHGVERLLLSVNAANEPARRLYEEMGFVTWGIEGDAFRVDGQPVEEVHMALAL